MAELRETLYKVGEVLLWNNSSKGPGFTKLCSWKSLTQIKTIICIFFCPFGAVCQISSSSWTNTDTETELYQSMNIYLFIRGNEKHMLPHQCSLSFKWKILQTIGLDIFSNGIFGKATKFFFQYSPKELAFCKTLNHILWILIFTRDNSRKQEREQYVADIRMWQKSIACFKLAVIVLIDERDNSALVRHKF